jgi:hypothetical protein
MNMETTYKISEDDYVGAMKLFSKITPKVAAVYGAVILMLGLVAILGSGAVKGGAIGGLIGGGVVIVVGRLIVNPILARRHYKKYKAIQEPINIKLKDDGIELSTPDGGGLIRWEKIFKWRQNEEYLLVYPMPRLYHIIPKSIGKSGFDVSGLIGALREKVGNET